MDIPSKYKEIDVFKEGILLGLFFILIGILFIVVHTFIPINWLSVFAVIFFALGFVILFMSTFIPYLSRRQSNILLFTWNEMVYLFLGLPLVSICLLILPVSIYILFFSGDVSIVGMFCLYFVLALQLSSLIYTGVTIWLHRRSSGHPISTKIDKGSIEQFLYKLPSVED
ncbi:MAG: hypothetical protein HGN29_13985 [Asgard group archaeon]|nr:hypothetical protein [Asgard group archaeon]